MNNRDYQIIVKILKEIIIALEIMENVSQSDFLIDEKIKRAVSMTLINIGELVKNISDETKKAYGNIPWREISGLRDIVAHKYQTLKMEDVYTTTIDDLPHLKLWLSEIIKEYK
ncbi:HepT-like ribonuclease domain-containing protein [Sedimentibacter sp.]|uniref:HepT-like ribonuclease domain-containing protein n=1 Tax=Sedimentibacter sp. TaxID=1960295 RepID=UPI00289FC282|nr:HepT-like ribonuclease domain-containing protein [Sedimentibacter sp.]